MKTSDNLHNLKHDKKEKKLNAEEETLKMVLEMSKVER